MTQIDAVAVADVVVVVVADEHRSDDVVADAVAVADVFVVVVAEPSSILLYSIPFYLVSCTCSSG